MTEIMYRCSCPSCGAVYIEKFISEAKTCRGCKSEQPESQAFPV